MKSIVGAMVVVACAACGGGGGGLTAKEFLDQDNAAYCDYEVRCGYEPDVATCLAENGVVYWTMQFEADIAAGLVTYDGTTAQACIDFESSLTCTNALGPSTTACRIFSGTVAQGGTCYVGLDCMGSMQCNYPTSCTADMCCTGTCQPGPMILAQGADCSAANTECGNGLYCSSAIFGARTCKPIAADGQPCYQFSSCLDPDVCMGMFDPMATMGTCRVPPATGEICNPNEAVACADTHDYCDPTSGHCAPMVALGQSCAGGKTCATYATCDATTSMCTSYGEAGASCMQDYDCRDVLFCDSTMHCALPPALCP
jgi:hypothetical protein